MPIRNVEKTLLALQRSWLWQRCFQLGGRFMMFCKKHVMKQDYKTYLESEINQNDNLWLQRDKIDIDQKMITLNFNGEITEATKSDLINELKGYEYLQDLVYH